MKPFAALAVLTVALAVAPASSAKGRDAVATLHSPIALEAAPGTVLQVRWTMAVEGRPFLARSCFVRFRSRTGATATEGFAGPTTDADGRYRASLAVPEGGLGAIEIGVAGIQTIGNGPGTRADWLFRVANSPFGALPAQPSTSVHRYRDRG